MKPARLREDFLLRLASVEPLLALFELLPDVSFFMKDRQSRFIALNRQGCDYCGVRSEREAIGKTDRDFFPAARAAEYMADDETVMRTGEPLLNRAEPAPEMAGSPRLVVTSKVPLHDRRGQIIGLVGFSRRIEQVRAAPSALKQLGRAVERLHREHASPLTTRELAALAGLSESQFERTFRRAFGSSPRQYLLRIRVENACRLLAATDATIGAVAVECGFYDHAHLTRAFRSVLGVNPSQYRKEHRPTVGSGAK